MTRLQISAFETLADSIADAVLDGRIVVLRGQPWSGRSALVDAVAQRLGEVVPTSRSSGLSDGAALVAAGDAFEAELTRSGPAALLVDDFGAALGTQHGVAFQNRLHAIAVDGPHAPDAGVLLVARQNESLTRFPVPGGGSPIAGAAHANFDAPTLTAGEVRAALVDVGTDEAEANRLVETYGGHLKLVDVARQSRGLRTPADVVDAAAMRVVSETTGTTAERMLALARRPERALAAVLADGLLPPAVFHPDEGVTRLCPALTARGIQSLMVGGSASWPGNPNASVRRFAARLYAMSEPLWVDRYHGTHLDRLTAFLGRLSARSIDVHLRLLGSEAGIDDLPSRPEQRFRDSLDNWAKAGLRVEWRIASGIDYDLLHQRMLVSADRLSGYLLPPGDRITGAYHGGTDTDAVLDPAPLTLLTNAWTRARPFASH